MTVKFSLPSLKSQHRQFCIKNDKYFNIHVSRLQRVACKDQDHSTFPQVCNASHHNIMRKHPHFAPNRVNRPLNYHSK